MYRRAGMMVPGYLLGRAWAAHGVQGEVRFGPTHLFPTPWNKSIPWYKSTVLSFPGTDLLHCATSCALQGPTPTPSETPSVSSAMTRSTRTKRARYGPRPSPPSFLPPLWY
eukprot:1865785-Rhodomonas_salina.1